MPNPQDNYAYLIAQGFTPPFIIELGPGKTPPKPNVVTIGLNAQADPYATLFYDLNNGIPLPDNCALEINSNQLLEHIRDLITLMNDIYRVLIPGGTSYHSVPHYLGPYSWGDPTHVRAFTPLSFQYFCLDADGQPFVQKFSDYGITARFLLVKQETIDTTEIRVWLKKPNTSQCEG